MTRIERLELVVKDLISASELAQSDKDSLSRQLREEIEDDMKSRRSGPSPTPWSAGRILLPRTPLSIVDKNGTLICRVENDDDAMLILKAVNITPRIEELVKAMEDMEACVDARLPATDIRVKEAVIVLSAEWRKV